MPPANPANPDQRRLSRLYAGLSEQDRLSLLAFAEFLASRARPIQEPAAALEPKPIPRPEEESVVGAIRRLSASYFMLERQEMLSETASLMTAHVMQGRPAARVIDDLERLFKNHYERYRERHDPQT